MNEQGFEVSAFGHRVAVLTESREALIFLGRYLLPWLPRCAPNPEVAQLLFRVSRNQGGRGFDAYAGGRLIASGDNLPAILGVLQCLTDDGVVHSLPDLVAVHAGVVVWNGCAVLLPGASQAGKTTLVTELLQRGALYYSDEYALLDGEGRVHAYPRALLARCSMGWRVPKLAPGSKSVGARSPVPARLILGVEWVRDGMWNVQRIPQSQALLLLLRNTPQEMANRPEIVSRLLSGISSAACFTGTRGEAGQAADHVMGLIADLG